MINGVNRCRTISRMAAATGLEPQPNTRSAAEFVMKSERRPCQRVLAKDVRLDRTQLAHSLTSPGQK